MNNFTKGCPFCEEKKRKAIKKKLEKKAKEFGRKIWEGEPIDLLDFYKTMKRLKKVGGNE